MKRNITLAQKSAIYAFAAIAMASAFAPQADAAQRYGRDSVYAEPGKSYGSASANAQVQRFGRDSVYATKETVLSPSRTVKTGDVAIQRFGRDSVYATRNVLPSGPNHQTASSNPHERGDPHERGVR